LVVSGQPAVSAEVSQDGVVSFKLGTAEVTRYHAHSKVAKPYFWPVITPGGVAVTRDWPMVPDAKEAKDHKHQKSAWFCHGDVVLEGYQAPKRKGIDGVDFWSEETGHGTIVATAISKPTPSGQGSVTVRTSNIWKDSTGKAILTEARTLVFRSRDASSWVMEVTSEITASEGGIVFEDTKEGSFGVRVRDDLTEKPGKGVLTNAEGLKGEKNLWGKKSAWCDYSGPTGGKVAGVAIVTHPDNKYPTCWHARGYGLMAANPFGRSKSGFPDMKGRTDLVKLAKGETLKLTYAMVVHDGDAEAAKPGQNVFGKN
jgi:hypothetical protein